MFCNVLLLSIGAKKKKLTKYSVLLQCFHHKLRKVVKDFQFSDVVRSAHYFVGHLQMGLSGKCRHDGADDMR